MANRSPAVCELDNCGILAVRRCNQCKRAFCLTHQAIADMCLDCYQFMLAEEVRKAAEEEARRREEYAHSPQAYIASGQAQAALLTAGVPTVKIYRIEDVQLKHRYYVDEYAGFQNCWILGEFRWVYQFESSSYGNMYVDGDLLTALTESNRLIIVETFYSPKFLVESWHRPDPHEKFFGWEKVVQTIKRLAGQPN